MLARCSGGRALICSGVSCSTCMSSCWLVAHAPAVGHQDLTMLAGQQAEGQAEPLAEGQEAPPAGPPAAQQALALTLAPVGAVPEACEPQIH